MNTGKVGLMNVSRLQLVWRLVPLIAVMALFLTGCGDETLSALKPKGPVAQEQVFLMLLSLGIMMFVFVVVMCIYIFVLVRYRKRKGQEDIIPKQVEGNHLLEIVWTTIPIILLIILAIPTVSITFSQAKDYREHENAVHVKVTAYQFWWEFEYPEYGIVTAQDLVIPTDKYIQFDVVAADVNHSFWIPPLGGKIDANVGITNKFHLKADAAGVFKGKCAELCGDSHTLMDFKVNAMPEAEFNQWVEKMKAPLAAVPAEAEKGAEIFKNACISCHAINVDGKSFGPNLNGFADRLTIAGVLDHTEEDLRKWLKDPEEEKPGNKMYIAPLSDDEIDNLVKYLYTLK